MGDAVCNLLVINKLYLTLRRCAEILAVFMPDTRFRKSNVSDQKRFVSIESNFRLVTHQSNSFSTPGSFVGVEIFCESTGFARMNMTL